MTVRHHPPRCKRCSERLRLYYDGANARAWCDRCERAKAFLWLMVTVVMVLGLLAWLVVKEVG